jgi:hypothetical protein
VFWPGASPGRFVFCLSPPGGGAGIVFVNQIMNFAL